MKLDTLAQLQEGAGIFVAVEGNELGGVAVTCEPEATHNVEARQAVATVAANQTVGVRSRAPGMRRSSPYTVDGREFVAFSLLLSEMPGHRGRQTPPSESGRKATVSRSASPRWGSTPWKASGPSMRPQFVNTSSLLSLSSRATTSGRHSTGSPISHPRQA
jgi:hypothetical protein